MIRDNCITPLLMHCVFLITIIVHASLLDEAQDFLKKMLLDSDAEVRGTLLGDCRNLEMGKNASEYPFDLDPEDAGHCVSVKSVLQLQVGLCG